MRKRHQLLLSLAFFSGLSAAALADEPGLSNSSKIFTDPQDMREMDWSDPAEMDRSWRAALVRMPHPDGGSTRATVTDLKDMPAAEQRLPTVIYLHGCSGVWYGTHDRMTFLADNGFLVIAPISLAREKYPLSCDEETHQGGLYRPTLRTRQHDAGHTIERARGLPLVDPDNIFLVGLSEGGLTTATFQPANPQQAVKARVVEGWTCHAGWPEYKSIGATEQEPVLTLVGADDPWFQNEWTRGECTPFIDETNGSRSIVYREPPLASLHELLDEPEPRQEVLQFLKEQLDR